MTEVNTPHQRLHGLHPTILIVLCLLLAGSLRADGSPNVSGHLVTRSGKTINFTRVDDLDKNIVFAYGPEDKKTSIPVASIAKIVFGEHSSTARIDLKDGRAIDAKKCGEWSGSSFSYHYFDDVARKEQSGAQGFNSISVLVFHDTVGHFRRCPHCKAIWPDAYLFCPHDGVKTVWGETSGALSMRYMRATPEERAARRASVIEAVLNASLARSGIDPASPEAEKAKEFGKLWMDPMADPKDIQEKLKELREDFQRKSRGE